MMRKGIWVVLILFSVFTFSVNAQTPKQIKLSNQLTEEAIALYQAKKYDQAKKRLAKAIDLNPKNVKAHEMSALLFYRDGNYSAAAKHAQIAIEINPKSAAGYYVLGMVSYQKQDQQKASFHLNRALKLLKDPQKRSRAQNALDKLKKMAKNKPIRKFGRKLINKPAEQGEGKPSYQPYVAVFTFDESNAAAQGLGKTLSEMLITALIQGQSYQVMERMQLEKILQEQSLSLTGVIDEETALKVGKLAGLEAVILGSVSRLNNAVEADARLIDVQTGKALGAANDRVNNIEKMRDLAKSLAKKLAAFAGKIEPLQTEVDSSKAKN